MKSQKWGLAVVLALGFFLLPFCVFGSAPGQVASDQKAVMDVMEVDQGLISQVADEKVRENMKVSLAHYVAVDLENMKSEFRGNRVSDLVELLKRRGAVLTTPAFKKIPGEGSREFWQGAWSGEATLRLVPVHAHISAAIAPQLVPFEEFMDQGITRGEWEKNAVKYDAVAVVIFEFHIVSKPGGATSHNDTGLGVVLYRHKTGCPWG